jgi:hypothetical protein
MRSVDQLFAHLHNVNPIADRVSPACDIGQVNKSAGTPGYEDPLYGNCWSWTPAHGAAVYGRTNDLPVGPLDELANGAFLRVPFRRVPVIEVRSIEEGVYGAGSPATTRPRKRGARRMNCSDCMERRTSMSPPCYLPQRELICTSRTASVHRSMSKFQARWTNCSQGYGAGFTSLLQR